MKITLPQLAWHDTQELELDFPDSWQIEMCHMAGFDRQKLGKWAA